MDTFGLKIIASDGVFYEGRCKKLIIPAPDGEKGILANHENMVIAVNVGVAHMSLDGEEWKDIAVGVGFVEIVNNRVTLIVDTAEKPEDIDVRRAQEQKERAEERLRQQQSIQQYYHTQASLARAMNRLRVSQDKKWNLEISRACRCAEIRSTCRIYHLIIEEGQIFRNGKSPSFLHLKVNCETFLYCILIRSIIQ